MTSSDLDTIRTIYQAERYQLLILDQQKNQYYSNYSRLDLEHYATVRSHLSANIIHLGKVLDNSQQEKLSF